MMTSSNGTFSTLLAICAGNSPVTGEFPAQRPVTRGFDAFFDLRLIKRLCKQSWGWWYKTPSRPLWRHCNDVVTHWRPRRVNDFGQYRLRWWHVAWWHQPISGTNYVLSSWSLIDAAVVLNQSINHCETHNKNRDLELPLMWRHDGRHGVSNHQPYDCLLNRLFRRKSKKTSKLRITGLCAGNSPVTGGFPVQMVSNAGNVSICWRHQALVKLPSCECHKTSIMISHIGSGNGLMPSGNKALLSQFWPTSMSPYGVTVSHSVKVHPICLMA